MYCWSGGGILKKTFQKWLWSVFLHESTILREIYRHAYHVTFLKELDFLGFHQKTDY